MTNQEAIRIIENVNANNNCINCFYKYDVTCEDCRVNTALKMAIKALESQKTGHWIEKNINQDGTHNIYCSNCNNYQKFKGHANSYNARTKLKYCPNCGAKMEGE